MYFHSMSKVQMDRRRVLTIIPPDDKLNCTSVGNPFRIPRRSTGLQMESSLMRCCQKIHWSQFSHAEITAVTGHSCSSQHQSPGQKSTTNCLQARVMLTDVLQTKLGQYYLEKGVIGARVEKPGRPCRSPESAESDDCGTDSDAPASSPVERSPVSGPRKDRLTHGKQRELLLDEHKSRDQNELDSEMPSVTSPNAKKRLPSISLCPLQSGQARSSSHQAVSEDSPVKDDRSPLGRRQAQLKGLAGRNLKRSWEASQECCFSKTRTKEISPCADSSSKVRSNSEQRQPAGDGLGTDLATGRGTILRVPVKGMRATAAPEHIHLLGSLDETPVASPSEGSPSGHHLEAQVLTEDEVISDPQEPSDQERTPSVLQQTPSLVVKAKSSPPEPIVLSSDEEEEKSAGEDLTPSLQCQGEPVQEAEMDPGGRAEASQVFPVLELTFSALHVGRMKMEANGNIMITNHGITVPLRDCSGEVELSIALVPSQLHRYGVWAGAVDGTTGEPDLQFLFLWVSDAEAELLQMDLAAVHPVEDLGKASPFLLLTLSQPLDSIHKAILSSMMDMMGLESENADLMRPFSQDQGLAALSSGTDTHILSVLGFDLSPIEGLQNQAGFATGHNESQSCPVSQVPEEQNIDQPEPSYTLLHHRVGDSYEVSMTSRPASSWRCYQHQNQTRSLIKFPPPPFKRGITVTIEDLQCLDDGEFLNDVIIDFYLNYLILEKAPREVAKRSHVFSSFFYKQLTRKDNASEDSGSTSTQHRRHQKVRTWTRNIDIFNKDYLFIPVNQESHWYLVVICFPGLEEPQLEEWSGPASMEVNKLGSKSESRAVTGAFRSQSLNGITQTASTESGQSQETVRGDVAMPRRMSARGLLEQDCTQLGCRNRTVCKRPCILIMDSLKQSVHERVFKLLREYLEVEWEVRRGVPRNFTPENMTSSHCMVPKQDNSSDCGLYLLQYAESFLQNPVVHFDLPLHLETWFSRQTVRRKREEIRSLVLHLCRRQQSVQ